jgi:hypothetical protein
MRPSPEVFKDDDGSADVIRFDSGESVKRDDGSEIEWGS